MRFHNSLAAVALVTTLTPAIFADTPLPASLGTLTNPADQTITFGAPDTTSSLTMNSGASLINLGTWNAYAGTIAVPNANLASAATISNSGTLNIDASFGDFSLLSYPPSNPQRPIAGPLKFTNTGIINLTAGNALFNASDTGSSSGTITLSTGTSLALDAAYAFDAASSLTGAGNVTFTLASPFSLAPVVTFNGDYSTTGNTSIIGASVNFNTNTTLHNLQMNSAIDHNASTFFGTIAGAGTVTLTGAGTTTNGIFFGTDGPIITNSTIKSAALLVNGTVSLNALHLLDTTAITVAPTASLALLNITTAQHHATLVNNGFTYANGSITSNEASPLLPSFEFTNNASLYVDGGLLMGIHTAFNNNGTVTIHSGNFQTSAGTDSNASVINNTGGLLIVMPSRVYRQGTINNAANLVAISGGTAQLGPGLTLVNTGTITAGGGSQLLLAAAQQSGTTGSFSVQATATLEFAANYDFSAPTGPSLLHNAAGDGLIIIDAGITLTLPSDTPFAGDIQHNGTLVIAPPLNPANAGLSPNFTVLPAPEPATLSLLAVATPLLLRRRRR